MPSAKAAQAASEALRRIYGDAVSLRFHNLADPAERSAQQEALDLFAEEGWPLPVTLLDGQPLFVGGLQPAKLVVEVARELARRSSQNASETTS